MKRNWAVAALAGLSMGLLPAASMAQSVNITRSILADQPYTLIYPEAMIASGGAGESLTINHPQAPLQCDLTVVPVEDTGWTAEAALGALDAAAITNGWSETLPGFTLGHSGTAAFQDATALFYDGTSTDSPMGMPLTLVHAETVSQGRGYALDCLYATEVAEQARPIVDFILANFATRSDAECCIGAAVEPDETEPQAQ
ncbi:MAG: hypothetical protein KIS86_14865 [Devosia sp.]|nr:hypothetical protein [Devosia sp.]